MDETDRRLSEDSEQRFLDLFACPPHNYLPQVAGAGAMSKWREVVRRDLHRYREQTGPTREEVIAAITLGEEDGRVTIFTDNEFEDYQVTKGDERRIGDM